MINRAQNFSIYILTFFSDVMEHKIVILERMRLDVNVSPFLFIKQYLNYYHSIVTLFTFLFIW